MSTLLALPDVQVAEPVEREYGPRDYETAFHVWHGPGARSVRRTASLTGYPKSTVATWRHRFGWDERSADLDGGVGLSAARSADAVVSQLIAAGQVPSIVALHEVIADPKHRDRVDAAMAMLGLGGRVVPKHSVNVNASVEASPRVSARQLASLSPDELASLALARLRGDADPLPLPLPPEGFSGAGE